MGTGKKEDFLTTNKARNAIMAKKFEDLFSKTQADMVSRSLDYVENRADDIFIHCSYEEGRITCNVFYRINGKVVRRSKVNDALTYEEKKSFQYNISDARQQQLVHAINDNIEEMAKLCKEENQPVPAEIKIRYNVRKNSMKSEFGYDLLYSNKPDVRITDIFDAWFSKIKNE
jgi:hypothetical protein